MPDITPPSADVSTPAVPAQPAAPPVPAAAPKPLAQQIAELSQVAQSQTVQPDLDPTPPVSEPDSPLDPANAAVSEPPATPSELTDDEEFKLSWEEDSEPAPTTPEPGEDAQSASPPTEKLTAEGLAEVQSYINEQLKLDEPESERMWGMVLKLPRARKALEAYKTLRDVEKPWEEGGVGYIPDTKEIRSLVESRIAVQDLMADLTSDNPQSVEASWLHLIAPQTQSGERQIRAGMEQVLPQLPTLLHKVGGQALYNTLAKPVIDAFMHHLYTSGESTTDPKEKEWLINTARGIDWRVNKTYRKTPATNGHAEPRATDAPPTQDPKVSRELEQLRARNQELESTRLTNFRGSIQSDEDKLINLGLDEALAVYKAQYPENVYKAVRNDFLSQVRSSLSSNPVFQREYDNLLNRAYQNGDTVACSELTTKFRQQAGNTIKRFRAQFLKSIQNTTAERRTEADKDRAALSQVQNKVGPTSTGQTARQQVSAPNVERPSGMSQRDYLQQRISQITSTAIQ